MESRYSGLLPTFKAGELADLTRTIGGIILDEARWAFLHEEALSAVVAGAFMRGGIYEESCSDSDRLRVRIGLKILLQELGETYETQITDEDHIKNVESLADAMTADYPKCLRDGRFRIGIAQKALNLYLKYLWCHGKIRIPPHCPFDGVIIGLLPAKVRRPYTQVVDIEAYNAWVVEAKRLAGRKPLSLWELEQFENQRMK